MPDWRITNYQEEAVWMKIHARYVPSPTFTKTFTCNEPIWSNYPHGKFGNCYSANFLLLSHLSLSSYTRCWAASSEEKGSRKSLALAPPENWGVDQQSSHNSSSLISSAGEKFLPAAVTQVNGSQFASWHLWNKGRAKHMFIIINAQFVVPSNLWIKGFWRLNRHGNKESIKFS